MWRKPNTASDLKVLKPTVKHGGGGVMVWGCMGYKGTGNLTFIDGIMDKYKYINILRENLRVSAEKLDVENSYWFQQDNDPKHTALIVRQWILYNCPHTLKTPPQSPDLNPIENLWAEVDIRLRKYEIGSKHVLKAKITEIWDSISSETTRKLVCSMTNRLRAVIAAKGGPTKY